MTNNANYDDVVKHVLKVKTPVQMMIKTDADAY